MYHTGIISFHSDILESCGKNGIIPFANFFYYLLYLLEHLFKDMPIISTFYGIIIFMFYEDNLRHHRPHIHAKYNEYKTGIALDSREIIYGDLPKSKMRLVQAWIEIHQKELMDDWELAASGGRPFKIEPLK
jgi:hypothetical protein